MAFAVPVVPTQAMFSPVRQEPVRVYPAACIREVGVPSPMPEWAN